MMSNKLVLTYGGQQYELWNDGIVAENITKVIKIDDRFIIEHNDDYVVLYPHKYVLKNIEIGQKIRPYRSFIEKYIARCDVAQCKRCGFMLFDWLNEDNHGGFYMECEDCHSNDYEELIEDLECQRCAYSLCSRCDAGIFDEENMEFDILLNALVLSEPESCADVLNAFPSATDYYVPRVMSWLQKYLKGEIPCTTYEEAWFLYDRHNATQLLSRLLARV